MELRQWALQVLCTPDPGEKVLLALEMARLSPGLRIEEHPPRPLLPLPGRPARPRLIHPAQVPRRSPFKPEGLAALLHAFCHIEFNAIKQTRHSTAFYDAKQSDNELAQGRGKIPSIE